MIYAEAAYFDGAHVQHIADYYEHLRLERIREANRKAFRQLERRRNGRYLFRASRQIPLASI